MKCTNIPQCEVTKIVSSHDDMSHRGMSPCGMIVTLSQSEIVTKCNNCVHSSLNVREYNCSLKLTQSTNIFTNESSENVMSTKLEISKEVFDELVARVATLEATIAKSRGTASTREMTDDDAKRVLNGDLKDESHKAAAEKLGLSYGQVYSCRGEYTFKHILKALKAEGFKNRWVK